MHSALVRLKEACLDILFPPLCAVCEKSLMTQEKADGICKTCFLKIPMHTALTCPHCHARLAENKKICHKDIPYLLAAAAPYNNEIIKKLIWDFKYEKRTHIANPLAHLLVEHMRMLPIDISKFIIVPIPLHKSRQRERGFNQAELLSSRIGELTSLPVLMEALTRNKKTMPQAETKNKDERIKNTEKAFSAKDDVVFEKNILLIDDVTTSGATLSEATKTLKSTGAKQVIALVVALA